MAHYTADNLDHIRMTVTLNGYEQRYVSEADTDGEMGYVVRALRNINGDLLVGASGDVQVEKVWGKVEAFPAQVSDA